MPHGLSSLLRRFCQPAIVLLPSLQLPGNLAMLDAHSVCAQLPEQFGFDATPRAAFEAGFAL